MTISEIAEPFDMTFFAISKHVRVLENAGLIHREIRGREHHCSLDAAPLRQAESWMDHYRTFWEERLEALERHVVKRRGKGRRS